MVRVEGWLKVTLAGKPAKKCYVVLDGYVLRLFNEEPLLSTAAAIAAPMDLRRVQKVEPEDVYSPGVGACQVVGTQTLTLAEDDSAPAHDSEWWIRHVSSAVPDRAVAPSLRSKYRHEATVIALITEHTRQPSAHGLTDKTWRKSSSKHLLSRKASSGPKLSPKQASRAGSEIGSRLEAARLRRGQTHGEPDDVPDETTSDALEGKDLPPSAAELPLSSETSAVAAPKPVKLTDRQKLERAAAGGSSRAAAALAKLAREDAPRDEPVDAAPTAGDACWFVRDNASGTVDGPLSSREMRRRYQRGSLSERSLVRFLPGDEEQAQPTAEGQENEAFAPLRELSTAAGPPFMEHV